MLEDILKELIADQNSETLEDTKVNKILYKYNHKKMI